MKNVFVSTSRERVMKSIKLELKPHPMTKKAMEDHDVMTYNRAYTNAEEALHPAIDYVAKKIISGALETCHEDFTNIHMLKLKSSENSIAARKYEDARKKIENTVKKAIGAYTLPGLKSYKDIGSADFLKKGLPELIKNASSNEISTEKKIEWLEILQGFQGASTLLSKFVTTRISLLENACPKRVLENYDIFEENMQKIKLFLDTDEAKDFLNDFPECISFKDPSFYEICMTPKGITGYNSVITGIFSSEGLLLKKGYNQFVTELNQKHRSTTSYQGPMFRTLKMLNQQILFPKQANFKIERMTCDDDVRQALRVLMETLEKKNLFDLISMIRITPADEIVINGSKLHELSHIVFGKHNIIPELAIENYEYRLEKDIESLKENLDTIAAEEQAQIQQLRAPLKEYKQVHKSEQKTEKYQMELDALTLSVSEQVKQVRENFKKEKKDLKDQLKFLQKEQDTISLTVSSKMFTIQELTDYCCAKKDTSKNILDAYVGYLKMLYNNISVGIADIMDSDIMTTGSVRFYTENKKKVKAYLDALVAFKNAISIIFTADDDERKNVLFYNDLETAYEMFDPLIKFYNQIRNFLVSKAGDFAEEERVFFGTPSKLASFWWSGERFVANSETIIRMDGKYYYVTRGYKQDNIDFLVAENESYYEVMSQKTGQDASKHIPKCVFSKECQRFFENNPEETEYVHTSWLKPLKVTREHYQIYKEKLFTVSALRSGLVSKSAFRQNLNNMLELYMQFCDCYNHYVRFTFSFRLVDEYADIGEFMSEANCCMLDTKMIKVSKKQIDTLINTGQIYAFLITNKCMYESSVGNDPYADIFLALMSKDNMKSGHMRLNAKPSITFRPACIPKKITHPVGSILVNKNTRSGNKIPSDTYLQIYNNLNGRMSDNKLSKEAKKLLATGEISSKIAEKDYIKDRRFMEDKFFISMSYVQNNQLSERTVNTITEDVTEYIAVQGVRTLSIVRDVTNLLYYILFDENREILQEGNLNVLNGVDYGKKLKELSDMKNSGKSDDWNYTLALKGVKEFYLHVAIGEICKIAYKNQAVICIENITSGFKDKMSALDNQIFSKFEEMLTKRLNDLKFPRVKKGMPGSVTNPLQLTKTAIGNPIQNGILFKVNPAYTASICPDTGFVNLFKFSEMTTAKSQREFLQTFDSIVYNPDTKLFELTFDYNNFPKVAKKIEQTKWKLFVGKEVYFFVGASKKLVKITEDVREIVVSLTTEGLLSKNLAEEELPSSIRKSLFLLIRNALQRNMVKFEKYGEENYFCSPALEKDKRYTQSHLKAYNLAKKLWFYMEHFEDGKFQYKTTDEWLSQYKE